ncbi:MAG: 50S ribosomal protein L18e [Candidatus Aenigmarchaeota archaeon]|nr:50S ribosomal protein L18e [Candidatus Aenigmarchaeota archaeon]
MKIRDKNEHLRKAIADLRAKGVKKPAMRAIALDMNRPRRIRREVNVYDINKFAKENETIAVAGSVLGSGEIRKAVNVYAIRFSKAALMKIEKAGGKCHQMDSIGEARKIRMLG